VPDVARKTVDLASVKHLKKGDALHHPFSSCWSPAGLSGRLVEITGAGASAVLTTALGLVREAQRQGETTAWIAGEESLFYPPDAAEQGVDLGSLVIVRPPSHLAMKAADKLARSGAFGLIAVDMSSQNAGGPRRPGTAPKGDAWLSRLLGLAQRHDTAVLFLTPRAAPLGTLVSLRGEARRVRVSADHYQVRVRVLKDKRRSPEWQHREQHRGPAGMY
jgi:recombination protein RecA